MAQTTVEEKKKQLSDMVKSDKILLEMQALVRALNDVEIKNAEVFAELPSNYHYRLTQLKSDVNAFLTVSVRVNREKRYEELTKNFKSSYTKLCDAMKLEQPALMVHELALELTLQIPSVQLYDLWIPSNLNTILVMASIYTPRNIPTPIQIDLTPPVICNTHEMHVAADIVTFNMDWMHNHEKEGTLLTPVSPYDPVENVKKKKRRNLYNQSPKSPKSVKKL